MNLLLSLSRNRFRNFNKLCNGNALRYYTKFVNNNYSNQKRVVGVVGVTAFSMFFGLFYQRKTVKACGIIGFIGEEPAVDYLLEGLKILLNRGYDSAGISTLRKDEEKDNNYTVVTTKFASVKSSSDSFDKLEASAPQVHLNDVIGIGHTRWATHGASTDENAHPHHDQKNRISLVHNGTIENAHILKKELQGKGITFSSQTDTEVIAQLIGYYLDEGMDTEHALTRSLERLHGSYGLVIIDRSSPDQIIAVRHGSPLVIGIGEGCKWIASEHTAFGRHTKQFVSILEGEIAIIKANDMSIDATGRLIVAPDEDIDLSPAPFSHWTLKEIMEQPEAIQRSLKYGSRLYDDYTVILGGLDTHKGALLNIKHIIISACGTSLYAAQYGARLMRMLNSFETVQPIDAAELDADTFPKTILHECGLLVVSQSGETKDVMRAVDLAQSMDMFVFSVINSIGSLIARTTNCGVYVHAGREHAVASTKAFVTQVTCLALIGSWFSQNRNTRKGQVDPKRESVIKALHQLSTYCGMTIHRHTQCKEIAEILKDSEHIFVLGKGFGEPIAYEGALKIKEITYIHAEGYSGGALKHGPFALIEDGTPIILIVLDDKHAHLMRTACEEVKARGAKVIVITNNPRLVEGITDLCIKIPSNGPLTALLAVIPLQLIAYELAILRGIDPDKPKNLAKAVTVD